MEYIYFIFNPGTRSRLQVKRKDKKDNILLHYIGLMSNSKAIEHQKREKPEESSLPKGRPFSNNAFGLFQKYSLNFSIALILHLSTPTEVLPTLINCDKSVQYTPATFI